MKKLIACLLIFASVVMAGVHAGLKDAIDRNDMKKATAIIERLGVPDVYCPATLSVSNGRKLYGARFGLNPDLLFSNCDSEFVEAYKGIACSSTENMNLCKRVLEETPVEMWLPILKSIKQNKLDKITEEYTEMIEVEGKGPRKSREMCEGELESDEMYLMAYENGDEKYANKMLKDCMNGKNTVTVSKEVKKKRIVNPFEGYFKKFSKTTIKNASNILGFGEDAMDGIKFIKSLGGSDNIEKDLVKECIDSYREKSYVSDNLIVKACRFNSAIDKQVEKQAGFSLFSCKEANAKYGTKAVPSCASTANKDWFSAEPIMTGAPSINYICTKGVWTEATAKQVASAKKKQEKIEKQKAREEAEREAQRKAEEEAALEEQRRTEEKARLEQEEQRKAEEKARLEQEEQRKAEEKARLEQEEARRKAEQEAEAERIAQSNAVPAAEEKNADDKDSKKLQKVKIKTKPSGAFVSIDGDLLDCTTPCNTELSLGKHSSMFSLDQYMVKDTTLNIKTIKVGKVLIITVELEPAK